MTKSKIIKISLASVTAVLLLLFFFAENKSVAPELESAQAPAVLEILANDVLQLEPQDFAISLAFTADVSSQHELVVAAPVSGILRRVMVRLGDTVKQGELLISVIDSQYQADYDDKRNKLASGKVQLEQKKQKLDHYKKLLERESTSGELVREAQFDYDNQVYVVGSLDAQLRLAKTLLANTRLTAPISGVIDRKFISQGQAVADGQELLRIIDIERLEIVADIHGEDIHKVAIGQKSLLRLPGQNVEVEAEVVRISQGASEGSRTYAVFLHLLEPPKGLQHGMFIKGEILLQQHAASLVLARDFLFTRNKQNFAYVLQQGEIVSKVLSLGANDTRRGQVQIVGGLQQGDIVVDPKLHGIASGLKARLLDTPTPTAAE